MRNEYKRSDIFICSNQAHADFNKKVSVYHVLKVKKCFPEGCVYFYWKCKKLNKGETCHKRYQHVGRKCFGCKEFYDVKITNQLKLAVKNDKWQKFEEDLQDFEEWFESVKGKTMAIYGRIDSVKPHFTKKSFSQNERIQFNGFILTFKECYIDRMHFEDFTFARIGVAMFHRYRFSPGDKFDFLAGVEEDRGRILFRKLHQIEFDQHQNNTSWDDNKISSIISTASELSVQLDKCRYCPHGVLIDKQGEYEKKAASRQMFCLSGIKDPQSCVIPALDRLHEEECQPCESRL